MMIRLFCTLLFICVCFFLCAQSGKITTPDGLPVRDVQLVPEYPKNQIRHHLLDTVYSDANGRYTFPVADSICENPQHVWIRPTKEGYTQEGITVWDVVLIYNHILGVKPFDNTYKLLAADANNSGSLSTFDIVLIQNLLLGLPFDKPVNTYWKFFDADKAILQSDGFAFLPPDHPKEFGKIMVNLNDNPPDTLVDFVAVKTGDVNFSGTNDPLHDLDDPNKTVPFSTQLTTVNPGEILSVPVIYQGDKPLEAVQISLSFNPSLLTFVSVSKGTIEGLSEKCFNLLLTEHGQINMVWFAQHESDFEEALAQGQILFYIHFKAKEAIDETDQSLISINDAWAPGNLAYTQDGTPYRCTHYSILSNNMVVATDNLWSAASMPTVVTDQCTIYFTLPNTEKLRLSVFNGWGHRVLFTEAQYPAGINRIEIPKIEQLKPGVYQWELRRGIDKGRAKGRVFKL